MADEEQVAILRKGVKSWNAWREAHPDAVIDLEQADLSHADLRGINLANANVSGACFDGAEMERCVLRHANIGAAAVETPQMLEFRVATFRHANLRFARLNSIRTVGTSLDGADCRDATFAGATLWLVKAPGADLTQAEFAATVVAEMDLSEPHGLDNVLHTGSTSIGMDTLRLSHGKIPDRFLRGCGLSDLEIRMARLFDDSLTQEQLTNLLYSIDVLRGTSPIQKHNVFISYSNADTSFVEALEKRFDTNGVRYWRDVHQMTAGPIEAQIDRAIRLHPVVILVLSESSVNSDWVEWEAQKARNLEKQEKRPVLCPVALDDAWKTCDWPGPLRQQIEKYHVLDLSDLNDRQFKKLLDGIGVYYPTR